MPRKKMPLMIFANTTRKIRDVAPKSTKIAQTNETLTIQFLLERFPISNIRKKNKVLRGLEPQNFVTSRLECVTSRPSGNEPENY